MARKLSLQFILVFSQDPTVQGIVQLCELSHVMLPSHLPCFAVALCASIVVVAALEAHQMWEPYSSKKLNRIETFSLVSVYV